MENITHKITTCLWFDTQAEEAAHFYTSIFKNSRIGTITRYGEAGPGPEGSVMVVTFVLDGHHFVALNGGPEFTFNEAISLQINCATQEEVDYFWEKLSEGGDEDAQQCGWLKDKFGVSWQVVPTPLFDMINDPDPQKARRITEAVYQMKKLDLDGLKQAYDNVGATLTPEAHG